MMRILALTNLFPSPRHPYRGTFNRQQFAALAREHDLTVIAPLAWTDSLTPRRRHSISRVEDVTVHHPTYFFPPKVLRRRYGHFMLASVRRCFHDAARAFRPDVVLASWAYPDGWAAVRLAREVGLPVAVKVHGSDLLLLEQYPQRRRGTIEALTQADRVIAVSRDLAETARRLGAGRVDIVYNGVDRNLFREGARADARARLNLNPRQPLVLFVGNLVAVKGVEVLIDACDRLRAHRDDFRCCLIGQGPLRQCLAAEVARRGLAAHVQMLGPRRIEDLPDWYRAAEVLVVPSFSEGIPNVVLEATACATPVVATRVGGVPEVVPPDDLVRPGDSRALAEAIARVLNRTTSSSGARAFQPGSWPDSARALAAVLTCIVPQRLAVA